MPVVLWDLPRRDLVLLPLIVGLTVLALAAMAEFGARALFVESGRESCSIPDAVHRYRMAANCVSHRKSAEGPPVEMAYNGCGYRTPEPCGPKPRGTMRIALLGASTAQGFKMSYEKSFAGLAAAALTEACRRPVEIQNMGVAGYKPLDSYLSVDEALTLKPDLVMFVLVPFDLETPIDLPRFANRLTPEMPSAMPMPEAGPRQVPSLLARINEKVNDFVRDSRAVLVAEHFLFQNDATFVRLQLALGDKADYLRSDVTPAWQDRYAKLDTMLGEMADKVHAAGVPFMLVLGAQHAQLALLALADPPPGTDPRAIGRSLGSIAQQHGILFVDTLAGFAAPPHRDGLFMPADGHMTAEGHAVFAQALVARLMAADVPAFGACASRRTAAQ